jgi:hypothetical protein
MCFHSIRATAAAFVRQQLRLPLATTGTAARPAIIIQAGRVLKSTIDSTNIPYTLAGSDSSSSSSSSAKSASSLLTSSSSSSGTSDSDRQREHEQAAAAAAAAWISERLEKELAGRELRRAAVREQVSSIATYASTSHCRTIAVMMRTAYDVKLQLWYSCHDFELAVARCDCCASAHIHGLLLLWYVVSSCARSQSIRETYAVLCTLIGNSPASYRTACKDSIRRAACCYYCSSARLDCNRYQCTRRH